MSEGNQTPAGGTTLTSGTGEVKPPPAVETPPAHEAGKERQATETPASEAITAEVEIKLPDGVTADEALLGEFRPLAKELGLKNEGAQKLVDLFLRAEASRQSAMEREQKSWLDALKADKEIGGDRLQANAEIARKALVQFGSPKLNELLESTGLGNHPELVRAFHRIGKALAEDSIGATESRGTQGALTVDEQLRAMYPKSPQMFPKE